MKDKNRVKLVLFYFFLAFSCNKDAANQENVPTASKEEVFKVADVASYTDPNFSLSQYPEMQGILSFETKQWGFIEEYLDKEVQAHGLKSGRDYNNAPVSSCAEILNATNTLRFRYSGENFDLHLKFISKRGKDYYLTNRSKDKLIRMQIVDVGTHLKSDIPQLLEYKMYSMENREIVFGSVYTDFQTYEECVKERGAIAEGIKGMSKDDLSP